MGSRQHASAASVRVGRLRLIVVAVSVLILVGCAGKTLVLPIRLAPETLTGVDFAGSPRSYEAAARAIAALLIAEFGVPLPAELTVFVYPTRAAYAEGLAQAAQMPAARAAEVDDYSVGLAQARRLFLNEEAFRDSPRAAWLAIVAHELTHLAQYELSGGRRGSSEQWLREGLADWVACRVIERLGEGTFVGERDKALDAVALKERSIRDNPPDLVELGEPHGWEARHLRSGGHLTYGVAFLMTDELIRRHGLERLVAYFRMFADSDDRFGNFTRAFGASLREFEQEALRQIRVELAERRDRAVAWPEPSPARPHAP